LALQEFGLATPLDVSKAPTLQGQKCACLYISRFVTLHELFSYTFQNAAYPAKVSDASQCGRTI